jgi:hypothetical protein
MASSSHAQLGCVRLMLFRTNEHYGRVEAQELLRYRHVAIVKRIAPYVKNPAFDDPNWSVVSVGSTLLPLPLAYAHPCRRRSSVDPCALAHIRRLTPSRHPRRAAQAPPGL